MKAVVSIQKKMTVKMEYLEKKFVPANGENQLKCNFQKNFMNIYSV